MREGRHQVAWQSEVWNDQQGREDRLTNENKNEGEETRCQRTPCGSFVCNEVSDLYKEVPSSFLASHLIKATLHPVPKVSER